MSVTWNVPVSDVSPLLVQTERNRWDSESCRRWYHRVAVIAFLSGLIISTVGAAISPSGSPNWPVVGTGLGLVALALSMAVVAACREKHRSDEAMEGSFI